VTFADGERLLVNNTDLDDAIVSESTERTYPPEYSEAIAALKEQHKLELERLSQELRIGLQAEVKARAEAQVSEQIQSLQNLYRQQKEENIQLQQRLDEMESLRHLETENQQLKERIRDLENALEPHQLQDWGNTYTKLQAKALNKKVQEPLEKTIDLRTLAAEPPKENATECLRLMGMALKNLSVAMNNTQALEAAALILGTSPTQSAIATRTEQLQLLPQAIREIRQVLARTEFTWLDFWAVAEKYEVIKLDYWAELTTQETDLITQAQKNSEQLTVITDN
jgi:vacuolar-type H+-ATPase subunit I/STV1